MSSISKPDHCAERASLALLSAYQEYLMTSKLTTSQVVQRARPLITHICVVGIQRVKNKEGKTGQSLKPLSAASRIYCRSRSRKLKIHRAEPSNDKPVQRKKDQEKGGATKGRS